MGIVDQLSQRVQKSVAERKAWLTDARAKLRNLPKTNFDLGVRFSEKEKWYDAFFRFKIVMFLSPNYPQARYNLACCYYNLGKLDKAKTELLQVLKETPGHAGAIFMLGAIDPMAVPPEQRPQTMPLEMVIKYFTSVAPDYNQTEAQSQYRAGKVVAEHLKPLLPENTNLTVVDLGCGTGIASIPYRGIAAHMIGVDVTPAMVSQAAFVAQDGNPLFEKVIEADITALGDMLEARSADVVLLVNVAPYLGKLEAVLETAARIIKTDGLLAITLEPYSLREGFGTVANTGRFGHSAHYVKQQAEAQGFIAAKQAPVSLYANLNGELLIFRKGAI